MGLACVGRRITWLGWGIHLGVRVSRRRLFRRATKGAESVEDGGTVGDDGAGQRFGARPACALLCVK